MTLVVSSVYDNGASSGNGLVTSISQYPGNQNEVRTERLYYDWRNRLVASKSSSPVESIQQNSHPIWYYEFDNQGRVTASSLFDGDAVEVVDANNDDVPDKPDPTLLRAYVTTEFDKQGRQYKSTRFSINQNSGTVSSLGLVTNFWYDRRGNLIKTQSPNSPFEKFAYDGASRLVVSYITDAGGDSTWSTAKTLTGDTVLEQSEYSYDGNSNLTQLLTRHRFHDAPGTGELRKNTSTSTPLGHSIKRFIMIRATGLRILYQSGRTEV